MHRPRHRLALTLVGLMLLAGTGCSSPVPKPMHFKPAPAENPVSSHPAVSVARQMLGTPYHYGGASPERGFDCSGLIYYSFKRIGINAPRTTETLYRSAFPVAPNSLRQGDLLFFRIGGRISHVGLYIGGDTFVHAPSSGKVVSYASLSDPYWRSHLIRAGRLF